MGARAILGAVLRGVLAGLVAAMVLGRGCGVPAPREIVCPCPQAEAEAWAEGGRLHLACVCPGGAGR